MNRSDILKKIPLFKDLNNAELAKLSSIVVTKKYVKGQIIFHEGERGEAMFFVNSGKVKIYKTSPDGREHTIF